MLGSGNSNDQMSGHTSISLTVNGAHKQIESSPMARLLDVLRLQLGLTGTKEGCGEGECGACAVLVNGKLVNSCLVPISQLAGSEVITIEGKESLTLLETVQKCFAESNGAQCGICTPGMVMATVDLLRRIPDANEAEIRQGLAGNLCRCTGYSAICASVAAAVAESKGQGCSRRN